MIIVSIFMLLGSDMYSQGQNQEIILSHPENDHSILLKITSNTLGIFPDGQHLFSLGIGADARLGKRWAIGADVSFGSEDNVNFTMIHPQLSFFPTLAFKGFFIKSGLGYLNFNAKSEENTLGRPFSNSVGARTTIVTTDLQVGVQTIVKNHMSFGVSIGMMANFSGELEGGGFTSSFIMGYAF